METKQDIRKRMLFLRGQMTEEEREEKSVTITRALLERREYRDSKAVLAYMDYNHEVITRYIIEKAWKDEKAVFAPRVNGKEMNFYRIRSFSDLAPGIHKIPEPTTIESFSGKEALVIVPGVAFDRARRRLGYGGGFYDRYLAAHPELSTLAVCFSFQILQRIPSDNHDIPMQIIMTEKETIDD